MSHKKSSSLVPTLRFPEFRDAGEWEGKMLGEICKFVRGPFGGTLKKEIFIKEGYAVYEQSHAISQCFDHFRYYIDEDKYKELQRFAVLPDDLIMSCSGTMGKFAIIPNKPKAGVINQALLKLTIKNKYDLNFIKYTLELPVNQEQLLSQSAGGAIKNVASVDQIKEIVLYMPNTEEQQKIAACLSSLDELITAHSQKLDALKKHKKGLMQQLFPAEGETVPTLRFPEFRDAGEWVERKLGEICKTFLNGGTPSTKKLEFWQGKIPWITGADVINQKVTNVRKFITEEAVKKSSTNIIKKGNLLIVTRTGVGKIAIAPFDLAISQDLTGIYVNTELSSTEYLYEFLNSNLDKIKSMNQGTSIAGITRDSLIEIKVFLPSIPEQQKIAACLSSLDELITAQGQKLDALKKHKKGLMQQLFPAVEEE